MNVVVTSLVGLAVLVAIAAVVSLPVMLLWDWLMPVIFGLPEITWAQALGLMLLCGFLFKNGVSTSSK